MLKSFRLNCILRVTAIGLSLLLCVWMALNTAFVLSSLVVLALALLQTADLVNYVDRTNLKIAKLVDAIENEDFSQQFYDSRKSEGNKSLVAALNRVIDKFSEAKQNREEALYFLQAVMDHSPVGILVCDKQGKIEFFNKTITSFFQGKKYDYMGELAQDFPELLQAFLNDGSEELKNLQVEKGSKMRNLSLRTGSFGLYGKTLTVLSLQNIHSEMEEQELESWQKLMRVLTHEIMNSVTPIISLAETTAGMIAQGETAYKKEILHSLATIQKRSQGLMHFTKTYRSVTKLPVPQHVSIEPLTLLETIQRLMENQLKEEQVMLEIYCRTMEKISCDPQLMEQVFLNLLLNSVQAMENQPQPKKIILECYRQKGRTCFTITDNGPGIAEEYTDKIFIPFFTSKKTGSGIGLSLCQQLMRLQGGLIRLDPVYSQGARMVLII